METSTLSKEEELNLKRKVLESLYADRFQLVVNYPFIGGILLHLNIIPTRDIRLSTAGTDGTNLYFDLDFYHSLTEAERCFVLAHETWHVVMLHMLRLQTRDPQLFNIATDMEVNNLIKTSSDDVTFRPPDTALFPPPQFVNKSAEDIYEWLLDNNPLSQSGSNDDNDSDESDDDNDDVLAITSGKPKNSKKNSKSKGKLDSQFDKHSYKGEDNIGDKPDRGIGQDRWGEKGFDPDFQPQIDQNLSERVREHVISEAQKCERTQGSLPAGIKNIIEQFRKPEISWKEELAQFVTIVYGDKRQWLPPNRRHVYEELYLQSRRDERIKVCIAVDTSGSCVADLPKFFGELISLMNSFGDYEVTVIYCDAAVQKVDTFDRNQPLVVSKGIQWKGGGGTSFVPPFEYIKEHGLYPDCFIYFTDGYGDAPIDPPKYPVLWILTSDSTKNFCSWGKKIKFKSK